MGGRDAEDCLNLAIQGATFDVVYCTVVGRTMTSGMRSGPRSNRVKVGSTNSRTSSSWFAKFVKVCVELVLTAPRSPLVLGDDVIPVSHCREQPEGDLAMLGDDDSPASRSRPHFT